MSNLIYLFSSISHRVFCGLITKVDSRYFIAKFQKWTVYLHSSILYIMIFGGFSKHSFVPHIFHHNQFLRLWWLNRRYCCNFRCLVKEEHNQFYYRKTHFCAWLISIVKYHFARNLHQFRCEKVPLLWKSVTEYAYHKFYWSYLLVSYC